MIVPRSRLLFWVAIMVLPFSFLGAVEPSAAIPSVVAIGGFLALVVVDGLLARKSLVGISLELPPVARMSKDREMTLEVRIRNECQQQRNVRLALALPREVESPQEEACVLLHPESEWSRFAWDCVPRKRGSYRLETANLETRSPFGFWDARKRVGAQSEIRVYPNLFGERRDLAGLFLHRGFFGFHAQRQVGKGREFEKLREYLPGDGFDEIHWKATAKRGRPVTKVFQIERTQEVYVMIDASRLSARVAGSKPRVAGSPTAEGSDPRPAVSNSNTETTLERYITAGLVLGLAAEQQGDLFGVLTFSNKVVEFVRAKNGKAHYSACRDALYTLEPEVVTPDYDEVSTFIRMRLSRRALLVFMTALDDPVLAESFVRNIDLIRRQHLVLVNMLQTPGVVPVFSNPEVGTMDGLYEQLGGHLLWQNLRELEKVLQRRGVKFTLLKNEGLSAQLVSQYLTVKRRQAL